MKFLYPDFYYKSVNEIPFAKLKEMGIKALIFDIDNTLTMHGERGNIENIKFFDFLKKEGFKCLVMSNNKKERVEEFATYVDVSYIYDAKKPLKKSYLKALDILKVHKKEVIFIGDQLFTDVLGANLFGIKSILVSPISEKEEIQIVFKRSLEKIILKFYKK